MVRERISGNLGVIITDECLIEEITEKLKAEHPTWEDFSKWDIQDLYELSGIYVDASHIIAVFSDDNLNSCPEYPEEGLIIWAKEPMSLYMTEYRNKECLINELKKTIKKYVNDDSAIDYDRYTGLILFTEYN